MTSLADHAFAVHRGGPAGPSAIWGALDPYFIPAGAEAFQHDLPDAELRLLPTGHFALETHLEEIVPSMRDFLRKQLDSRSLKMTTKSENGIVRLVSRESVAEVLRRLLSILRGKGITVFAVVDHSGEAAKAGMEMHKTELVIFGKPEAGTPVMTAAPDMRSTFRSKS